MTTWIILRAAGIGAYLMLFLSVCWGLIGTTGLLGKRISKASATQVHQYMSTTGLLLLAVHLGGLLVDRFMPFGFKELLVPMQATFKPVAVTFGIVAIYVMGFVIAASLLRKPIGTKRWRITHVLAVPAFTLALVHGIFAGTDTVRPAMWWTYVVTALIVLFLVVVRGLTAGFRPERAPRPDHARTPRAEVAPEPVAAVAVRVVEAA